MEKNRDNGLHYFMFTALSSWERLQDLVWGVRWDGTQPSLDFSRASLARLSMWMGMTASRKAACELDAVLPVAGQYFGETIQTGALAAWERLNDGLIGLRVWRKDEECRLIGLVPILQEWVEAWHEGRGLEADVLTRHYDWALTEAKAPM